MPVELVQHPGDWAAGELEGIIPELALRHVMERMIWGGAVEQADIKPRIISVDMVALAWL